MIPLFDSYALRPLQAEDASDIFRAIDTQRRYLGQWLPFVALTRSEDDSQAFVSATLNDPANPVYTLRAGDRFAGLIGFKSADSAARTIEIGYWLREEFQHRGIMTAAVKALQRIAFEELSSGERIDLNVYISEAPEPK